MLPLVHMEPKLACAQTEYDKYVESVAVVLHKTSSQFEILVEVDIEIDWFEFLTDRLISI